MNNYILIKAPKGWEDTEKLKQVIKLFNPELEVKDKVVFTCVDSKYIPNEEAFVAPQHKDYMKQEMARSIGDFLLRSGSIKFKEVEEKFATRIDARLTVVLED